VGCVCRSEQRSPLLSKVRENEIGKAAAAAAAGAEEEDDDSVVWVGSGWQKFSETDG
jgi:hypothetical protein